MEEEERKKKLEEKYITLQLIDAQLREIERQLASIESRNAELLKLKASLDSLAKLSAGTRSYSPLGLGIYAKSSLTDTKEVLVNVGANIMVKKSISDAKAMLSRQLAQSEPLAVQLAQSMQALATKARELERDIQELIK